MFENNDLDKIFGDVLSQTQSFHNADRQWEVVSGRLARKRRSIWFWIFPFLAMGMVLVVYNLDINQVPQHETAKIRQNEELKSLNVLSSNTLPVAEQETLDNSGIEESGSIQNISTLSETKQKTKFENSKKEVLNQSQEESNIQASECNCDTIAVAAPQLSEWNGDNNQSSSSIVKSYAYTNIPNDNSIVSNGAYSESQNTNDLDNEEITNKNRIEPQPIFKLDHLPIKEVESNDVVKPEFNNQITILNRKNYSIGFEAGLFSEAIIKDSLSDRRSIGWAVGMLGRYERLSLKVGYKNYVIDRTINSKIGDYDITDLNFVYTNNSPDSVYLNYTNHLIDLSLGYEVVSLGNFSCDVLLGLQSRMIRGGNARLSYGGVYEPLVGEGMIPNRGLELSAIRIGTSIEYAVYKSLGIKAEYNLALPMSTEIVKWPTRHQFEFGIVYQLYNK